MATDNQQVVQPLTDRQRTVAYYTFVRAQSNLEHAANELHDLCDLIPAFARALAPLIDQLYADRAIVALAEARYISPESYAEALAHADIVS